MARQLNHRHGELHYYILQRNSSMYHQLAPSYRAPVRFNPLMGIVLAMLFMSFFVLGWLAVYLKKCIRRQLRTREHSDVAPLESTAAAAALASIQATQGLDPDTILALPTVKFRISPEEEKFPKECSVCLTEFVDKELVKILPVCGHAFHAPCIDQWLFSNCTCPICRSSLALLEPCCKTCSLHLNALQQQQTEDGDVITTSISEEDGASSQCVQQPLLLGSDSSSASNTRGGLHGLYRSLSTPAVRVSEGSYNHRSDTCKGHEAKGCLSRALSCAAYDFEIL